MKIGLNATCFNSRPSGAKQRFVGIYGQLFSRLAEVEFVIYEPVDCSVSGWFDPAPNVSFRRTPIPSEGRLKKALRGLGYWPSAFREDTFDAFEMFSLPLVTLPSGTRVFTIHDLRGLRQDSGALRRGAYRTYLQRSLRSVDQVVTVSQAMRREILACTPDVTVSVVYNGLDLRDFGSITRADLRNLKDKYELPDQFLLSVGHLEERKNYSRLIEAVAQLGEEGTSCPLVIVGNDSGQGRVMEDLVNSLALVGSVRVLSGIGDTELRCLYKLCSLFVFPSVYEGFGIPVLEAMAAGCPMVLSDIPVFREITEGQGVYFASDDVASMAHAIATVLGSVDEQERLVAYGTKRVKDFSFPRLAADLECIYRSLAY